MKGCDIVKLIYLSQEAVDNIKIDFRKYRKHFKDETNEWFVQHFEKNGWMQESKIQCDEFSLDMMKTMIFQIERMLKCFMKL